MKKVAVYTFSNTLDNYGQVLQYLATQEFLDGLGFETALMRFDPSLVRIPFFIHVKEWLQRMLFERKRKNAERVPTEQELLFEKALEVTLRKEQEHPRHFEEFRQTYFRFIAYGNLRFSPPMADVYCVGSDQTWSGLGDINFLAFGPENVPRISFASSFGSYNPSSRQEADQLKSYLSRFSFVSVREKAGQLICQNAGRTDACLALDPTLLLDVSSYHKYEEDAKAEDGDYLLLYLLGNPIRYNIQEVFEFAEREGLEVRFVSSQGCTYAYPEKYATVSQWLSLVRHAKYVVTNSFHGAAFSIVYERPFLVIPLAPPMDGMNERIITLLDRMGLQGRMLHSSITEIVHPLDFDTARQVREKERNEMGNALRRFC